MPSRLWNLLLITNTSLLGHSPNYDLRMRYLWISLGNAITAKNFSREFCSHAFRLQNISMGTLNTLALKPIQTRNGRKGVKSVPFLPNDLFFALIGKWDKLSYVAKLWQVMLWAIYNVQFWPHLFRSKNKENKSVK